MILLLTLAVLYIMTLYHISHKVNILLQWPYCQVATSPLYPLVVLIFISLIFISINCSVTMACTKILSVHALIPYYYNIHTTTHLYVLEHKPPSSNLKFRSVFPSLRNQTCQQFVVWGNVHTQLLVQSKMSITQAINFQ